MLSLEDIRFDLGYLGLTAAEFSGELIRVKLRNRGLGVEGFLRRRRLRRGSGSAGCRKIFQDARRRCLPVAGRPEGALIHTWRIVGRPAASAKNPEERYDLRSVSIVADVSECR